MFFDIFRCMPIGSFTGTHTWFILPYSISYNKVTHSGSDPLTSANADPEIFQRGGGLRRKIWKEKCLLIHVSTRVHIKTRQTCNSFSLLPFQEDGLLFFALFYYSLLFLKFEKGGCNPRKPP